MATLKHINSKNADYGAAEQYLLFEHDEFTMKPVLDETGRLIPREDYRLSTLNCDGEDFAVACMRANLRYQKNQRREDVKSHHYIISFDPRDGPDNGLTVDRAQALGEQFCKEHFPGHQALVCTHPDGHNHSGNIHVHIVINSLRIEEVPFLPYMDRPADTKVGCKHRCTDAALRYFKSEVMEMCHREGLYQIDLLNGSKNRVTDREYWAQKKGQAALDKQNAPMIDTINRAFEVVFNSNVSNSQEWPKYPRTTVEQLQQALIAAYTAFGGSSTDVLPIDADIPRPFTGDDFLRSIEANAETMGTSEYVETMLMRVKTLMSDAKLKPVICPNNEITLDEWLDKYICPTKGTEGSITIIDLSLLPAEVTHIITAVMARVTLEVLQRYRRQNNGATLPTVLVMEEAHTFIKRYNADVENENATAMCTKVFEKIAREGRKYGLGLVLSSQRPSELSPTVISQCNSFLLHRLSNDRDQELVGKLVPDNLRGLLRELPSLPSRNAILLGWASELPVMVRMNYLDEKYRPKSDDPEYWKTWTESDRTVDWKDIADKWQDCLDAEDDDDWAR